MHFLSREIAKTNWTLKFVRLISSVEVFEHNWQKHSIIYPTQNHSTKATTFKVDIGRSHGRTMTDSIRQHLKNGNVQRARDTFETIQTKSSYDYNAMLHGLVDHGQPREALELFKKMTVPMNEYLLCLLFKICANLTDSQSFQLGKSAFETMSNRYRKNPFVLTSAIKMFMEQGEINKAEVLFASMEKTVVIYNAMISGYLKNHQAQKAFDLFFKISHPTSISYTLFFNTCGQLADEIALKAAKEIFRRLSSRNDFRNLDEKILNSALDMFVKCNDVDSAEALFRLLKRDVVAFGLMMKMYNSRNQIENTFALFKQMKSEKVLPNNQIYVLLINACARLGDLSVCESIISEIPQQSFDDLRIANSLIDMWGKSGCSENAQLIFDKLSNPDAISFSAMINAYGVNGMGNEAVHLFHQMPVKFRDSWSYVCVLNGCSHAGLISQAWQIFEKIPIEAKSDLIYTTMVDTLARTFHVEEAENLLNEFETRHPPYFPMYMSILSAARSQRDAALAQKIYDRIRSVFGNDEKMLVASTILLSNTYALSGDLHTASKMRIHMNQAGLKKEAGVSTTIVDGKIHRFRAHDRSHPEWKEIYGELDRLRDQLVQHGHRFDSSWLSRPTMNDETVESLLCGHSEKLAIAFNFHRQPNAKRIQLTENLRLCGDCHETTKLIAKIRQCLIVVRDANRIHHFYPTGQCSCQDHF